MENTVKSRFNEEVFNSLSTESQEKVEQIYLIAEILYDHKAPKITASEFDELYDKSVRELEMITGYTRFYYTRDILDAE